MSFTEKIDVLDLLINILREHEEKLDTLVERMENLFDEETLNVHIDKRVKSLLTGKGEKQ